MQKVTKAVITAAGLSSRMFPFTKVESKLMLQVLNKPVVEYIIEELAASGIKEVVIVSNHTSKVNQFFSENKRLNEMLKKMKKFKLLEQLHHIERLCKIDTIRQENPMGWMHEVVHAKDYVKDGPFITCFSDVIYMSKVPAARQLIDAFRRTNKNIRSSGRFLFKPSVFRVAEKENFEFGKDVADIDVFEKLREQNDLVDLTIDGRFHDIGNPLSYLKTQTILGMESKLFGKEYGQFLRELVK